MKGLLKFHYRSPRCADKCASLQVTGLSVGARQWGKDGIEQNCDKRMRATGSSETTW